MNYFHIPHRFVSLVFHAKYSACIFLLLISTACAPKQSSIGDAEAGRVQTQKTFAAELGNMPENIAVAVPQTTFSAAGSVLVGSPYTSALNALCRKVTLREASRQLVFAICRTSVADKQIIDSWELISPVFEIREY